MFFFDTRVRYSECNRKGEASVTAMINYLQDCCTFQSEDLRIGLDYLKQIDAFWILGSWQVDISRYPRLGEQIRIGTLPYEIKGFMGLRNFVIRDAAGIDILKANSVWVLMNRTTMKPVRATKELCEAYPSGQRIDMDYTGRKVPKPVNASLRETFVVPHYFLDTNRHVNNANYILLGEEMLPEAFVTRRVCVEYKRAAVLGDKLMIFSEEMDGGILVSMANEEGEVYANVMFYR